jgi:hypothetical protein
MLAAHSRNAAELGGRFDDGAKWKEAKGSREALGADGLAGATMSEPFTFILGALFGWFVALAYREYRPARREQGGPQHG